MSEGKDRLVETCLFWFVALTPLWWVCGILLPMVLLGVPLLFVLRPPQTPAMRWVVGLWFLAGGLQALSSGINWWLNDEPLAYLPRRLLTMYSVGWLLLGMCLGLGARIPLESHRLVRALALQGGAVLVLAAVSYALHTTLALREFHIETPLAVLKGSFPSAQHHFVANFFHMEDFNGENRVRLTLFFPWTAGLGVWGMVLIFASLQERAWVFRLLGLAGGLAGLLLSFSRATVVAFLLALCLLAVIRAKPLGRIVGFATAAGAASIALLFRWDPFEQFERLYNAFHSARQGSSAVRQTIYEWSWALWQEAPWIGYGRMGDAFSHWHLAAPIGSHSTFYGTLYTGGVMTFAAVAVAYLAMFILAARRLQKGGYARQAAFCMVAALGLISYGEGFFSLVPSLTAPLVWIGWHLGGVREPEIPGSVPVHGQQYSG